MFIQKLIWFFGRMIFYMLLLPLLVGVVYTLAHDQWTAAVIFLVLMVLVLYYGLIRVRIPANSVVVRDDKVVFFIPEKTARDRFDFVSRGQKIVELPSWALFDRPFRVEAFFPDGENGVGVCRLTLALGYVMELAGWQRLYEHFISYQDQLPLAVRRQLVESAARMVWLSPPERDQDLRDYLKPVVAELNLGLENLGLKIEEATCTFEARKVVARVVADDQVLIEMPEA
ncbi:hypothetical protein L4X63_15025 [Geomonas sp. Red32]|uniref:hypothetical protein n=1 Tax=Geomonas sp. Red32 TaxID=2912856 RepID=UPI00202CFE53|nr:hypothetical protein [Geomonas sp. Red32]MCM0082905.1 hypothetical protein [Geomonas sp. Red32]